MLVGTGIARADDCAFDGVYGSFRSPVVASGDTGTLLTSAFTDRAANGLRTPDVLIAKRYVLTSSGRVTQTLLPHVLSPTLALAPGGRAEAIAWRSDRGIVAGDRVLVAHLPFPG